MQCMRYVKRIKFFEKNAHTQFFFFEFHILNTKLGRRKSSDYKSTMARLLSQTLYSSPAVIRNAWHYISQFNQIEIVGNKKDKRRGILMTNFTLQAGIEFKKNLRVRFEKYGGLKLEYFWVVKSKKAKSFIRG